MTWNHLGVEAYAINLENAVGANIQIPLTPGDRNARRRGWTVSLTEEGDAKIARKNVWIGQQAFQMRADLYRRGKEGWEKAVREEYEKYDPPGQVESASWENEENPEQDLKGTLSVTRKGMAAALPGGRIEVSPLTMIRQEDPFTSADRNGPIYFPYPYVDEDTMEIAAPSGYVVDALPQAVEQPTSVGRYSVRAVKGEGETVRIVRSFELKRFSAGEEPLFHLPQALRGGDEGRQRVLHPLQESGGEKVKRLALAAALGAAASLCAAATAPDWVTRARTTQVPPQLLAAKPAPDAVVLWRQQIVTAGASTGSTKLFQREAVKVLTPRGSEAGTFKSSYDDDSRVASRAPGRCMPTAPRKS